MRQRLGLGERERESIQHRESTEVKGISRWGEMGDRYRERDRRKVIVLVIVLVIVVMIVVMI